MATQTPFCGGSINTIFHYFQMNGYRMGLATNSWDLSLKSDLETYLSALYPLMPEYFGIYEFNPKEPTTMYLFSTGS